ncbi:MAG: hypothetical protein ACJAXX_000155 [Roseivirga sp.]|jgi:hypothetical protein
MITYSDTNTNIADRFSYLTPLWGYIASSLLFQKSIFYSVFKISNLNALVDQKLLPTFHT